MGQVLLTNEEIDSAFESAFDTPINFDHKPTVEEIFVIRLRAVAKAQLKKVVEHIEKEGTTAYIYEGEYTYETKCDNVIILDLGDWQALLKEVE